MYHITNLIVVV